MTKTHPAPRVAVVVATLGRSKLLRQALTAIDRQRRDIALHLVVVVQGKLASEATEAIEEFADQCITEPRPLGFAAANNAALAPLVGDRQPPEYVALVNDDAVVADGWLVALAAHLDTHQELASVQGLNLLSESGEGRGVVDGAGIAWNGRWQAVQVGHGEPVPEGSQHRDAQDRFGVSATAALYRTKALRQAAQSRKPARATEPRSAVFDEKLTTYYEDVELACLLQHLGWTAAFVPAARCVHEGSASAPPDRRSLLIANRHLVLARYLGRSYLWRLPQFLLRDLLEFGPSAVVGWTRAGRLLPSFFRSRRTQALILPQA